MYQPVLVYEVDGTFIGKAIWKKGTDRLHSIALYSELETDELTEALERLNMSRELYNHWPDARDVDVQALLAKEDFYPIELAQQEVVDDENSYIVYEKDNGRDTPEIDYSQSVIKKKKALAPARISDIMERTKKAQEAVAIDRAGLLTS